MILALLILFLIVFKPGAGLVLVLLGALLLLVLRALLAAEAGR